MEMKQTSAGSPATIIEDSVQAGILEALGCVVLPEADSTGHVSYRISGDVEGCFKKLYENALVGSMSALRAIKAARQAIFSLRSKGQGQSYGKTFNR
jgi:hypothetical protein